jgi:hypothetical protein
VTPPAKLLRVAVMRRSLLPAKVTELDVVRHAGANARIMSTGFLPADAIEITVDGK